MLTNISLNAKALWAFPKLDGKVQGRENHFNLLRAIAAAAVLVSHAYPLSLGAGAVQPLEAWLGGHSLGWVAVSVFFVISGFFIAKSYAEHPSWRRFLTARALRLFPALLVTLSITVLVGSIFTEAYPKTYWKDGATYVLRNLTLFRLDYDLPGLFQNNPFGPTINGSLWTLFYEVVCYLGVLLAGIAGLFERRRLFVVLLCISIAGAAVAAHLDIPWRIGTLGGLAIPFALGTLAYVCRRYVVLSPLIAMLLAILTISLRGSVFV